MLPIDHYPAELCQVLRSISPRSGDPVIVTLTPGVHNSAYFEHSFLAQQMGVELVESRDLIVDADVVYMKTIRGLTKVDVCSRPSDLSYVLAHTGELVVKAVGESGGYGMLMGPWATKATVEDFRTRLKADPRNYIASRSCSSRACPRTIRRPA